MRQSLRLGRVAGIPVGVHWTVGVILLLIADMLGMSVLPAAREGLPAVVYWTVAVLGAVVFAGSLLVHELSHAIVAKRHGVRVRSITLWMLGGVAELDDDPPNPTADLRIALAGPASSLALAVLLAGLALGIGAVGGPTVVVVALGWLALMNGVLAVFN
ncbi:MAG: site-2 protease family protein, partial [Streptosporangiaceae bacterium]